VATGPHIQEQSRPEKQNSDGLDRGAQIRPLRILGPGSGIGNACESREQAPESPKVRRPSGLRRREQHQASRPVTRFIPPAIREPQRCSPRQACRGQGLPGGATDRGVKKAAPTRRVARKAGAGRSPQPHRRRPRNSFITASRKSQEKQTRPAPASPAPRITGKFRADARNYSGHEAAEFGSPAKGAHSPVLLRGPRPA